MDVAVTTGSTLWSGLAGPFPGRRDEGAGPRQTPREGQGLGAGGRGAWRGLRAGGRGARAGGLLSWALLCCTRERRVVQGWAPQALRACRVLRVCPGLLRA